MSNLATVASFLASKGLNQAAIAGVIGNLSVESGGNPGAFNANEGAIGIAQWEGSRRTALQQYAATHGGSENDLNTQMGFLWSEIENRGLAGQLNNAGSPGTAAEVFNTYFEGSAGTTSSNLAAGASTSQRVSAAQQYAGGGDSALTSSSSAAGAPAGAAAAPVLTPAQKAAALQSGAGPLYTLAQTVPELKSLITNAINSGQTAQEFQNAVTNSAWYRSHGDSVRQAIVLQKSDPATWAANLKQAESHIQAYSQQMGVTANTHLQALATSYVMNGWNDDNLKQWFQYAVAKSVPGVTFGQGGAAGSALVSIQQIASDYGVPLSAQAAQTWQQNIAAGSFTQDQFKLYAQHMASSMYPGLSGQLAQGMTTKQLADPYIQSMASTLELDPNTIKWTSDPLIKKALQTPVTSPTGAPGATQGSTTGTPGATAKLAAPTTTPLWQFEQQLKQDPRWQYTKGAMSSTAGVLQQLGSEWGYPA